MLERREGMTDQKQWYAGVDWASQSHHVFLTDGDGRKIGERVFRHGGVGLAEVAAWLTANSGALEAGQIQVAIEVPHGPVVETLIERGFTVHAINPKQMDRFRDRFTLAGAKDDSRDAEVMASAMRTDPRCFRPLAAAVPVVIELPEWSRLAEGLGAERNRLTNRMREQLWRYFPALLKRHPIRRFDAAHVLAVLRKPPVEVAAGTTEAASAHVDMLIARIRLVNRQLKQA
ncbi:IS110 family transposase [Chelativorans sp. ZYF759]|uniref:IS110 family transposase n=1 Tax=Chelativorans sp. ZYF759 TaxID=2692213 RepID=UPI001FF00E60|nr:IS110 family transposase [Chelativorans sp. ZYF759]